MPDATASPFPLRALSDGDWDEVAALDSHAFGHSSSAAALAADRSLIELERSIGAYDGDVLVGVASAYSLELTVPGGELPTAGVTWVGVLPSHRRRGLLTALMRRQLTDIRDAGREPLAALWASEAGIYGRFGYGSAASALSFTVPRDGRALLDEPSDRTLRARLVDPKESVSALEAAVREADRRTRPGMFVRDDRWQQAAVFDDPGERNGRSPLRCVVFEDAGGPRAYAYYATEPRWTIHEPSNRVHVREVHATDPAAYAAVWRYLLDIDLSTEVLVQHRALDDPLLHLARDRRRLGARMYDSVHVRLVDLVRALAGRTYAHDVDVVLEVRDDFCPWNAGSWRLRSAGADVTCEATRDDADLALSSRELGAAFLGGTTLHSLAAAGLVEQRRPGALALTSSAFRHEPLPWCPQVF